jgi:hypothetical protein
MISLHEGKGSAVKKPLEKTFLLRLTVVGCTPRIWRRLLVRESMWLSRLHDSIQVAFDWYDYQMHEFVLDDARFGNPVRKDEIVIEDDRDVNLADLDLASRVWLATARARRRTVAGWRHFRICSPVSRSQIRISDVSGSNGLGQITMRRCATWKKSTRHCASWASELGFVCPGCFGGHSGNPFRLGLAYYFERGVGAFKGGGDIARPLRRLNRQKNTRPNGRV